MSEASPADALGHLQRGDPVAAFAAVRDGLGRNPEDPAYLFAGGQVLLATGNAAGAVDYLNRSVQHDATNVAALFALAVAHKRLATHRDVAIARDILLRLVAEGSAPVIVVRNAAECCSWVGPMRQAVELWAQVALKSEEPEAYFRLSEALAMTDRLPEALLALQTAVRLDPERYAKSVEDLQIAETARRAGGPSSLVKKGRYPETELIQGNLRKTIIEYVAADNNSASKFISRETTFFTMGSCFARNIVKSLKKQGYTAAHMEISEFVNTTYANRHFVDWLEGSLPTGQLSERIQELIPPDFSKEILLEKMKTCHVFILTLGVAPAFFDRETGEFVMPRPTALNMRALAEKYRSRTTSVAENVDNVVYLLSFLRKLNPSVKLVVTVSPVPMQMTFEFKSAVAADCLSKSTLRVAAQDIVYHSGLANIYYWPSFEVFRWLGGHLGPVYGTDDGAAWHVSESMVDLVISCFTEMFATAATQSSGGAEVALAAI